MIFIRKEGNEVTINGNEKKIKFPNFFLCYADNQAKNNSVVFNGMNIECSSVISNTDETTVNKCTLNKGIYSGKVEMKDGEVTLNKDAEIHN